MKVVLDTSAIIFLNDFRSFDEIFTVPDVIREVKDKISSLKLSGIKLNVLEPDKKTIKDIKTIAETTGDLEKLSNTDIKVLALAKENNLTIISDDYNIQNVAEKSKINYVSLFNKKITKLVQWQNYCENCRKYYNKEKNCPVCGGELARKPVKSKTIS